MLLKKRAIVFAPLKTLRTATDEILGHTGQETSLEIICDVAGYCFKQSLYEHIFEWVDLEYLGDLEHTQGFISEDMLDMYPIVQGSTPINFDPNTIILETQLSASDKEDPHNNIMENAFINGYQMYSIQDLIEFNGGHDTYGKFFACILQHNNIDIKVLNIVDVPHLFVGLTNDYYGA